MACADLQCVSSKADALLFSGIICIATMVSVHKPPTDISVFSAPLCCSCVVCVAAFVILQGIMTMLSTEHVRCCIDNDISCIKGSLYNQICLFCSCFRLPKHRERFGLCGSSEHDGQRPDMHVMVSTRGGHFCYLLIFATVRITYDSHGMCVTISFKMKP